MNLALLALFSLLLGAAAVWLLQREELTYLRSELRIAQDRLLHAWRDEKALIPPRPEEAPPPPPPIPPELQEYIDAWDSPDSKAATAALIRARLDQGMKPLAIMRELEERPR